jgi:hypothetical protein
MRYGTKTLKNIEIDSKRTSKDFNELSYLAE